MNYRKNCIFFFILITINCSVLSQEPSEYLSFGLDYLVKGDFESALEIFEKGISKYPSDAILHYQAGAAAWNLNQYNIARDYFQKAAKFNPNLENRIKRIDSNFGLLKDAANDKLYIKLRYSKVESINDRIKEIKKFISKYPNWVNNNKLKDLRRSLEILRKNTVNSPLNVRLAKINQVLKKDFLVNNIYRFEIDYLKKHLPPSTAFKILDSWNKNEPTNPYTKEINKLRISLFPEISTIRTNIGYAFTNIDVPESTEKKYRVVDPLLGKSYIEEESVTYAGYSYDKLSEYFVKATITNKSDLNLELEAKIVRKDHLSEGPGIWSAMSAALNNAGGHFTDYKSISIKLKPGESKSITLNGRTYHRINLEIKEISIIN